MIHSRTTTCLLMVAAGLLASRPVTAQTEMLAFTGVGVVDVAEGRILPNSTVVVRRQTIVSVTPNGPPPAGARIVDGRGRFLIPGLWDMHAHIQSSGEPWLQPYVANGVTGIREMGADLDFVLGMRDATASGRILGPRIVAAGPILDDAPGEWPHRMRVRSPEEGRAAVRLLKQRGVDLIKVHNFTPRDVFFVIAEEAHRQDLRLAGHVPLKVTAEEAVDAGLSNVEHLIKMWMPCSGGSEYRPEACRPFFETLARRQIWQTPTLFALFETAVIGTPASSVSAEQLAYASRPLRDMWAGNQSLLPGPDVLPALRAGANAALVVVSDMAKLGVPILAGCDAMIAGFCVHDELAMMVLGGMSPPAALRTATLNPARYLGLEQTTGTVAAGKRADLVLLDANPFADIANVRRIRAVVVAGRFLDRSDLDQMLVRAKTAAARP